MRRLSGPQLRKKGDVSAKLSLASGELKTAIEKYNELVAAAAGTLQEVVETYNEVVAEAQEFIGEVKTALEDDASGKSEKWQEGDAGQAHEAWREAWDVELEEYVLEEVDEIGDPEEDVAETFEELPEEVEGS